MKYIIMCGGTCLQWNEIRQLTKIKGEPIVARTIRLLKEAGVTDINISTNNVEAFEQFGVPILQHDNEYTSKGYNRCISGTWCNAFYPTNEPTTYLFGDVVYSPAAIRTIIDTETDDIMFFGSKPPFAHNYPKWYIEPFCFKVIDTDHLKRACDEVKRLDAEGKFRRQPIAWEVWNVICGGDPNDINYSYTVINDYTCDVDYPSEVEMIERYVE